MHQGNRILYRCGRLGPRSAPEGPDHGHRDRTGSIESATPSRLLSLLTDALAAPESQPRPRRLFGAPVGLTLFSNDLTTEGHTFVADEHAARSRKQAARLGLMLVAERASILDPLTIHGHPRCAAGFLATSSHPVWSRSAPPRVWQSRRGMRGPACIYGMRYSRPFSLARAARPLCAAAHGRLTHCG